MVKVQLWSLLALTIIIPVGVRTQPSPPIAQPLDDPEAYNVYAAVLPEEWPVRVAHAKTVVFQEETVTNWKCLPSGKPLETDWLPVMQDLRSANATPKLLRAGFDVGMPYVVVPSADIRMTFRSSPTRMDGWGGFYKQYPDSGGYIAVSAVGFDASKQRAIVYMEHSCGELCAGGAHHLLEQVGGIWRRARPAALTFCVWRS